jgi:8-oxo-dGTP diphosphatase
MDAPLPREIACAVLIDNRGRFLLQQRDDVPGILQPGKIGLFGGHREGDETYLECLTREIHEEISFLVPLERIECLASHNGVDIDVVGGAIHGEFFVIRDVPVDMLVITEGSLLTVSPEDMPAIESKLTPSARLAMKAYLDKYGPILTVRRDSDSKNA